MKKTIAVIIAIAIAIGTPAAAQAAAKNGFSSEYTVSAQHWGATTFTVDSTKKVSGSVSVYEMVQNPVAATKVTIKLQQQTCGTFGCHWRDQSDAYMGSCTVTGHETRARIKDCAFTVKNPSRLHRVHILKSPWDNRAAKGRITIK